MSSSSLDTSSAISDDDPASELSLDDAPGTDRNIAEARRLTARQESDAKRYRRDVLQAEKKSKKWAKVQVSTVATIKDAELVARRFDIQRVQAEFAAELAAKEGEIDAEMRDIEAECSDLRLEIQSLELELSDVKEQRKRNLLSVRAEIAQSLNDMRQKEAGPAGQIQKLQSALAQLSEKHRRDIEEMQAGASNGDRLIDVEIQRIAEAVERCRKELYRCDEVQGQRMNEAQSTIEMLRAEIQASNERSHNMRDEIEQTRGKLGQLQQELFKAEERSQVLVEQLQWSDGQKKLMKLEIGKLDRSLWNTRRAKLLQTE
jgi:chromosome segregation ATPase